MKRTVVAGFLLLVLVEAYAAVLPDRRVVAWAAGAALVVLLAALRWSLRDDGNPAASGTGSGEGAELLAQWLSRTENLIGRAESTRVQWDRHLRPRLAREFAAASGHRQARDPAAFSATGITLFGPELWQWVDPDNISAGSAEEPGPGRAVLGDILQRLEQL